MHKYLSAWLVMLLVSIANGGVRDLSYGRNMDELSAHQLSTLSALVLLGLVIRGFLRARPPASAAQALGIGLLWLGLTLAFEFLFFHYVGGHSWQQLLSNYNLLKGRVWVFVPVWISIAPVLFFHIDRRK